MQACFSCSARRRFHRAGHTLRDFNDNHQYNQYNQYSNLLFQQPVGGVSTGLLEHEAATHYYWLPTPQGDILVGFDQGINSYAVYTDHLGTPRLVTKIDNPQNPKPITDTSNDLPLADYDQPEGISPLAIPVWQWSYSAFGADLANGYEAQPTSIKDNFKPSLWAWVGLPETGGADFNQVAQEAWRVQANLHIPPVLNIRYPGQYYDFESGLVQNWWRTYEPRIGRYTSADPIGLGGGWNRFAYVEGDGINLSDQMGLATERAAPLPTSQKPNKFPDSNWSFGAGGSCHILPLGIGLGADSGGIVDSSGNFCIYSNICYTVGPGYSGGLGLVAGAGTGLVQSGSTKTQGATWTGGAGFFGSGTVVKSADGSKGYGRGFFGVGGGGMAGYQKCEQVTICTRN